MRCGRCVLSASYPGLTFNADGICDICQAAGSVEDLAERRHRLRRSIDTTLADIRSSTEYDCIVAFSGGKDSAFTLCLLSQEYRLRCLAVTVDNGFLSALGIENCRTVTEALGVDFILYKPDFSFMRTLYIESLNGEIHARTATKRASGICNSCIGLINAYMLKLALRFNVPLIAGGYLGGQVPTDAAVITMNQALLKTFAGMNQARYGRRFGTGANKYFALSSTDIERLGDGVMRILNPLVAAEYSEDEIVARISDLGWRRPSDTGRLSSNCRLNDVGILSHIRRFGFHPYETELADLVRKGLMSRDEALAKLAYLPGLDEIGDILRKLGIDHEQL